MRKSPPSEAAAAACRTAAGLVFTGLLVFAPLNFGSTRSGGPGLLAGGCAAATALWLCSLALRREVPALPRWATVGAALVVAAALPWLAGWVEPTSVLRFTAAHFARIAQRWPHSLVWSTPANTLALTVALAVAVLPLLDLARSRRWALAFAVALAGTAAAIGVLSLAQSFTRAPGMLGQREPGLATNFAGTFYHHTSAGAYFNTAWPLAVALAVLAAANLGPNRSGRWRFGLALGGGLVLVAAHGSHVSRFPQVAALAVLPFLWRGLALGRRANFGWGLGAVVAAATLAAFAGRGGEIVSRWELLVSPRLAAPQAPPPPPERWAAVMRDDLVVPGRTSTGPFGDRGESWRTALRAIAERPLLGHGPDNWRGAASHHSADPFVRTFFLYLQFAHQDVLQSAVEWGVVGAAGCWTLLLGGLIAVARTRGPATGLRSALALAAACGLAAVLLQSQLDFPLRIPAVAFNAVVLSALAGAASLPSRRDDGSAAAPAS